MNNESIKELETRLNTELGDIHEYFSLDAILDNSACLDGVFTPEQLRRIADAQDKLWKAIQP